MQILIPVFFRSSVRTMSDMEEAEKRLNFLDLLLANVGLDA